MVEITELQKQIRNVALVRAKYQEATEAKKRAIEEWERQNVDLMVAVLNLTQDKEKAEASLREMTLQIYKETGEKKPCEGVGIREITKLEYDPKEALKWAMSHQIALSLDKKSFEGFAKATPLDFVEIHTEVQATIATELKVESNAIL